MLRFWFGFSERVNRRQYFLSGVGLMLIKYLGEAGLNYFLYGVRITPWQYLNPALFSRLAEPRVHDLTYLILIIAWSLPFIWVGASMSLRRSVDAGFTPWVGLLFFVPALNYLLLILLSVAPSRAPQNWGRHEDPLPPVAHTLRGAMLSVGIVVASGMLLMLVSVFGLRSYGSVLFAGVPVVSAAVAAYYYNRLQRRSFGATAWTVTLGILLLSGAMLIFSLEGAICLAMAFPIQLGLGLVGACLGRAVAFHWRGGGLNSFAALILVPAFMAAEKPIVRLEEYEVVSSVEVNAPIEKVWRNVISFPELSPPSEWYFKLGIAYPVRARLIGKGTEATRYCDFSTGSFTEPITQWKPPYRLTFGVSFQPKPMRELSPYEKVYALHLDGYFRTTAGEFRLVPLGPNRTRLEGSTWYHLDIHPNGYWRVFSDAILHRIHLRVLDHIRAISES